MQCTWDFQRNSNLEWAGNWKPRCRFEFVHLKQSGGIRVKVVRFGLVRLAGVGGGNPGKRCLLLKRWKRQSVPPSIFTFL